VNPFEKIKAIDPLQLTLLVFKPRSAFRRRDAADNVIETHEHKGDFKMW